MPPEAKRWVEPKRWIVWLCCGCEDCEPAGSEDKSSMPCSNSPSMNGGVVVLAKDYEDLAERLVDFVTDLRDENGKLDTVIGKAIDDARTVGAGEIATTRAVRKALADHLEAAALSPGDQDA